MISQSFKDEAKSILKLQNDAEDEVISKLQENLDYMDLTENVVDDYQNVLDLTKDSYAKLNAAGKIKPQHELKAQVEKVLSMIANEEQSAYSKAKMALMLEATESVTAQFSTDDAMKKAGLDHALAKLTGKAKAGSDPVQAAFVKFFNAKSAAAKKADDGSEEKAARVTMLTKMNSIAENEKMYFRFDEATGQPKMTV
jgi:CO dehydrogenase nickel-insertion accessory protein CooC1